MEYNTFVALLSIVAIIYLKRKSVEARQISDNVVADVSDTCSHLTNNFLKSLKRSRRIEMDDRKVGADVMSEILGKDVLFTNVVIGHGITNQVDRVLDNTTEVFNLRDILGVEGEIALTTDPDRFTNVQPMSTANLITLIDTNKVLQVAVNIRKILDYRWEKLRIACPVPPLNNGEGFAYIPVFNIAKGGIKMSEQSGRFRINMLCENRVFNSFIDRMSKMRVHKYLTL